MRFAGTAGTQRGDSLARRTASAAIGIPVLLLLIWVGGAWFTAFVVVVALLGLLEFYRLGGVQHLWRQRVPGAILTGLLVINGHRPTVPAAPLALAALPILLVAHAWSPKTSRPWLLTLAGPLYLGATLAHAVLLRRLDQGTLWILLALLGTFSVDTGAYFVGRAIGRRRMAPKISPGKTWEGALGGLLAGIGAAVLLQQTLSLPIRAWEAAILGAGTGVVAQAGDLLESALKRAARVKEAGWLIPGHGGLLDRLDSIVFTLVLLYYGVTWGAT